MGILEGKHLSWAWKEENILLGRGLEHRRGFFLFLFFKFYSLILRETNRQTLRFVVPHIYTFIG